MNRARPSSAGPHARRTALLFTLAGVAIATGCNPMARQLPLGIAPPAPPAGIERRAEAAVVLTDDAWLRYSFGDGNFPRSDVTIRRALLILRPAGLEHAELRLTYDPQQPIYDLEARTRLPSGEVVAVSPKDVLDTPLVVGDQGGERRVKVVTFPHAGLGSVVEYRYSQKFPSWLPYYEHAPVPRLPTLHGELTFDVLPGIITWIELRGYVEKGRTVAKTRELTTWELRQQEPEVQVALQPPRSHSAPRVALTVARLGTVRSELGTFTVNQAVFETWANVGQGFARSVERAAASAPPTLATPAPHGDPAALAREAWARTNARVHARWGVHDAELPTAAAIARAAAGTADERAIVMMSLLRAWDVPAYAVLMPGANAEDLVADRPSPRGLEDLLLLVGDPAAPTLVLDPACLGCAAGELAAEHQGRQGLAIELPRSGGPTRLWTSPSAQSTAPSSEVDYALSLSPRGLVADEGRWTTRGTMASYVRHYFAEHPLLSASQRSRLEKRFLDGVEGGGVAVGGLEDLSAPIVFQLEKRLLRRDGYVDAGPLVILPVRSVFPVRWLDRLERARTVPVQLRESGAFRHHFRLTLPADHRALHVPEATSVESPAGRYALEVTVAGGVIEVTETLQLARRTYSVAEYPALFELVERARTARRQAVELERPAPTRSAVVTPSAGAGG